MSTVVGETQNYAMKAAHRDRIELEMRIAIGAAGAVVSPLQFQDDPNMTVVHGSAGVYALTFPPGADANGQLDVTIVSPAGTVKGFWCTAFAPNSGTASITCSNGAGVATDPANGDVIMVALTLSGRA
jgi:hypothetical protein